MEIYYLNMIEECIDRYGLDRVLEDIGIICREKADHIREAYDDQSLARRWDIASDAVDHAATIATKELP